MYATYTEWPTTIKFVAESRAVYIYYTTKVSDDITVKVTMVDATTEEPISYPSGTTKPLSLYTSTALYADNSTVSGTTVTFGTKIKKGTNYRIGQNTAIADYQMYNADGSYSPGGGANQTPLLGVSTTGYPMFDNMPIPTSDWTTKMGVQIKYDKTNEILDVKIPNKKAITYKLSVELPDPIDLWVGDPQTAVNLTETFRGKVQVVVDQGTTQPAIVLNDNQYKLEITTASWDNSVTTIESPRVFNVKVTPTAAVMNQYSGVKEISGPYLRINFLPITYDLQAEGVPQEYWTNDPQPTPAERLNWVKDVKVKPSNTTATDATATAVDITGIKGGSATTEVDMTKLGETIYLVTVTAKKPLNNNETIKLENVEVPITIVTPPTYELKINVVDADGNPINYEEVSAPFGYTFDGEDNWDTTATTKENVITFTKQLEIQSKYQIEQSDVLEAKTDETNDELPNDNSVIFPPESGITPPGSTQELHTKTLTETYPWNDQKPSLAFVVSRDESQLSYGTKTYETTGTESIDLAEGLKAQ